jgi:hypothetical protein
VLLTDRSGSHQSRSRQSRAVIGRDKRAPSTCTLLAEDSVDQRMLEILATKAALFDEYVRHNELKETPMYMLTRA